MWQLSPSLCHVYTILVYKHSDVYTTSNIMMPVYFSSYNVQTAYILEHTVCIHVSVHTCSDHMYTMYTHGITKPGTDVSYHQGSGTASQATPRGRHRIRAGVGFELAI